MVRSCGPSLTSKPGDLSQSTVLWRAQAARHARNGTQKDLTKLQTESSGSELFGNHEKNLISHCETVTLTVFVGYEKQVLQQRSSAELHGEKKR